MRPITIYKYIFFGTAIRYLQDVQGGYLVHTKGGILENIDCFFKYLDEFELPVTKRAAFELEKFKKKLRKTKENHNLTSNEAEDLQNIMSDLRKTIDAESQGRFAYIVSEKRVDVKKLLLDISALMPANMFKSLPVIAQNDFREGGRCIAFELPTAAAFHFLRGTEDVVRQLYFYFVKRKRIKNLTWGRMVNHLKDRKRKPSKEVLDHLINIKDNFRNPTDHPDKIYDIEEAQALFGLCVDIIYRMMKTMKTVKTVKR